MKLLNFTIIKLTFCLIIGICIGHNFKVEFFHSIFISATLLSILGLSILLLKKQFKKQLWIGVLIFSTTVSIGILTTNVNNQLNFKTHFSKQNAVNTDSSPTIRFRVREVLKSSLYHDKYVIDILKLMLMR